MIRSIYLPSDGEWRQIIAGSWVLHTSRGEIILPEFWEGVELSWIESTYAIRLRGTLWAKSRISSA
jgi:hypothetical protein